jgi:NAD(P)-dependent dehydrogenase (short-subunit alcohol dehydrogenase family)
MGRTPSLAGKVVLVTGAGAGIGAAGARELHRRGARPVLVDCDRETVEAAAAAIGEKTMALVADVTSAADCEAAVAAVVDRYQRIDIVWANAGVAAFGQLAHIEPAAWRRCYEVNVMGVFNTVRAALPELIRQRGFIAVSASVSSFAHPPAMSAYAASKAAVEAMCNSWRIELASQGVGVGVIHASWVKTALVTEGALHPGFVRLRQTVPGPMNIDIDPDVAACRMVDGIARRDRRIWVPGWVRILHWLRPWLHTPAFERDLVKAAPDIERFYLEGLAAEGRLASSFGPREHQRALERLQRGSKE